MVSDTRSTRKSKSESDGQSTKRNVNTVNKSSVSSSGNADKTSTSRQMTPSPQSTRKSKRLDKDMPPVSPPVDRKSERFGKYNTPSPLRRSDRGKKEILSCSSGSKQSSKEPSPSESKRKKEKPLIEVTLESEKVELKQEAVGMKRKKMDARRFRGLFKMQRIQEIVQDGDKELDRLDKSFDVGSDHSGSIGSEQMGVRYEGVDRASKGAIQNSISTLKGRLADIENENDIHVDSSLGDSVVNEPCSNYPRTSSIVGNISDNPASLQMNCFTTKNMATSESEGSSYSARSGDGSVGSDNSESSMHPEDAEAIASSSSKCENYYLLGTCVRCSKNIRLVYGSPAQELCSCIPMANEDRGCVTCKERGDLGDAFSLNSQRDGFHDVCSLCNKDGELLCCMGRGCKRRFHVCCLDPSLTEAPVGVWHCPKCVKRKLLFGVHSISEGVESIWDVREVDITNGVRQKQYLVKYHGLAHIHNHWVSETQLLSENPCLVSNFVEKDQFVRWSKEWMVPHRLLRKRPMQDKIFIASSAVISVCEYEWLVKWRCLDYDHATWELDNSSFLSSSLGQDLMNDYEVRRQKAKKDTNKLFKEPVVKLPVIPASRSQVNVNHMLKNVNKLRECLFKCLNAVLFDDQERAMTAIYFIQSMIEICQPFLIVTTTSSLRQWEAEFAQLVPSLDVIVYSGSTDTRKGIRASELYDEEGCMMVQVLLSSVEAVSEDLEMLRCIKWKAIIIDDYQLSGISNAHEQLKMLSTDIRILLVSGKIKDTTSEYLKILSLIEPQSDFDKLRGLKPETNDSLCKLKERLSRFIVDGRASQVSKFIEYWVPVQISNYQLEQYCDTLLSNSIPLCSYSKSDRVGALRDILLTVRKCCCHPYLLDPSVQERLVAEQCPAAEFLDIGIKASGKLQFLDMMLSEIKARGLHVLILFQLIIGSGKTSTGDILDDFLRQRLGPNTYERVEAGVAPFRKHAALSRFNKKETEPFVMLLENRACSSAIKLSSVDAIIIYDSDWNPANDLRALQRISIDSTVEQIKIFRLYSSFTIEERALVHSKQNLNLDNNLQTFSRATSDALLSWGATYLFRKLDEYHADSKPNSPFNFSSEQSLLEEVTKEFQGILSENYENTDSSSVISEVKLGVGNYSTNIPVLGETKFQLKDGEEPQDFWKNLFDGRNPKWKHLKAPSPRNRKRVHYWEGSPTQSEFGKDDMVKKRKKTMNENLDPALVQVESGPSTIKACNQSEPFQRHCQGLGADVSVGAAPDERIVLSDEQKSFHTILQGEMMKLCRALKFTEDATQVVRKFLEYVIKNHHVNSDSQSIVQAFQISLCWVAASITKQKVDKKDTFMLAKQLLNYQCTEEQAHSVYSKMRSLKRMYLQYTDGFTDSDRDCLLTEEDINRAPSDVNGGGSHFPSPKQKNVKVETGEKSSIEEHGGHIRVQQNLGVKDKTAASEIDDKMKKIQRKCDKQMKKLVRKHQQEIQESLQIWEKTRQELEKDHKLELAFIRTMHYQDSVGLNKLKLLEDKFAKNMEDHNLLSDAQLKELKAKQLAAIDEERLKAAEWLAEAKACSTELKAINGQQLVDSQSDDDAEHPQPSTHNNIIVSGEVLPMSGQHVGPENQNMSSKGNDFIPSISSIGAPAEGIGCKAPVENIVTTNSQNEMGEMSPAIVTLNQSKDSSGNGETVSVNLPAPVEHESDAFRSVGPSELLPVPNEMVGHVHPGEISNAANLESDKAGKIASSFDLVSQRGGTGQAASDGLHSSGQPSLPSEQTIPLPDYSQQVHRDETTRSLVSAHSDVPAVENQSASQIEVASSEPMDSVAPVPFSHEDPVNESAGNPPFSSVCASLDCNQASASENHDQGRSSSQAAEHGVAELLCPELISLSEDSLEMHSDHLDIGPSTDAPDAQRAESSAALQNDVSMRQVVASTLEQSNQAIPQLKIDVVNLCRPINNVRATHQPISWNSAVPSSLLGDPLQKELERILRETEQLEKIREDKMSQLKVDCDKEIEEVISQIRNKYAGKLQETEAEFRSKRNQLDKNQKKVMLNKILADAVRSKCLELKPSGLQKVQQALAGVQSNSAQQAPLPPWGRRSLGPSGSQTTRIQPITSPPALQTPQQLSRSHPSRSSPIAIQSIAPPTITAQPVHQAAPHVLGPSPRPPVINAISPAGNPRGTGNEIRSIAPHLQPSRPPVPSSTPPTTSPLTAQLRPIHMRPSQPIPLTQAFQQPSNNLVNQASSTPPTTSPSTPQLRPIQLQPQPVQIPPQPSGLPRALPKASPGLVTQDRAGIQPAPPNPFPTTQKPSVPEIGIPSLPDISRTFSSLELCDLEMLDSNVQGNQTSDVASPVVCLSDDD